MIYYFDTSALVKVYHTEEGSETMKTMYHSTSDRIIISNLAIPETFSAFHRKSREGVLSELEFRLIVRKFFTDITRR